MKKTIFLLIVVSILLAGCDYIDVGQLWAYFDPCGYRTTRETATGYCKTWWDIADGKTTEQDVIDQINYSRATSMALAKETTSTPTRIPTPIYKPINIQTPTPYIVKIYSPLPTPTPDGFYVPDISDYDNLLDWYFE